MNTASKILIVICVLLLACTIFFGVKYKRANDKYETELNDPYRLHAIDSINNAITIAAQYRIDSMQLVIIATQSEIDSIKNLNNKIVEKYDGIYKEIEGAAATGDDIAMAYRLLAINRKIPLERK